MNCLLVLVALCSVTHDRPVMALASAHSAALFVDGVTTTRGVARGGHEADPISRLLIGRSPTWKRMIPVGAVVVIGEALLAERMKTSHHAALRRVWWLPQAVSIGVSFTLAARN